MRRIIKLGRRGAGVVAPEPELAEAEGLWVKDEVE